MIDGCDLYLILSVFMQGQMHRSADDHYQLHYTCDEVLLCCCQGVNGTKVSLLFLDKTEVLMTFPDVNLVE